MPTQPTEEPGRAARLKAILDKLHSFDRIGQPAQWQTDDVRYLVTLLLGPLPPPKRGAGG